jgi:DNA topoisomerase-1
LAQSVVIVESPSKAKTINKYLGSDYKVIASYGHVRDLPSKNGSVNPNDNFSMIWELDEQGKKRIKDIVALAKGAKNLFLATDPDREGEAISWHIQQVLEEMKATTGMNVQRIVFNEITKRAVQESLKSPRAVNKELVDAYLARRALDYLVGFTLSPILSC